jgi:plastocyanin
MFCSVILMILAITIWPSFAEGQLIPDWIKNVAKWYGEGQVSETEFLNAIKYLIDNKIILLKSESQPDHKVNVANIVIPNGNSQAGNVGFYMPLNLEAGPGTTVVWINEDNIQHTIVSQDDKGNVIPLFNSKALNTGERFAHKFDEAGVYHYFCTIHPWRVGVVTIG